MFLHAVRLTSNPSSLCMSSQPRKELDVIRASFTRAEPALPDSLAMQECSNPTTDADIVPV